MGFLSVVGVFVVNTFGIFSRTAWVDCGRSRPSALDYSGYFAGSGSRVEFANFICTDYFLPVCCPFHRIGNSRSEYHAQTD